ncbi:MAG: hypothetical protein M3416_05425 [Acidobacteriota bacterium]|nr:hypothetical protein [Acidobacteriota bacterium]
MSRGHMHESGLLSCADDIPALPGSGVGASSTFTGRDDIPGGGSAELYGASGPDAFAGQMSGEGDAGVTLTITVSVDEGSAPTQGAGETNSFNK